MKQELTPRITTWVFLLVQFLGLVVAGNASADIAILADFGVLVETNPEPETPPEGEEPLPEPPVGGATNASYVSEGGWAVTGIDFIDAAAFTFDFQGATSVVAATLIIPIAEIFEQNDAAPIQVFFYSDNGVVEFTDYSIGFIEPIEELDASGLTELRIDVTGAVNSALNLDRFVGFRVQSATAPSSVDADLFPRYTGIRLIAEQALLEFVPGPAPIPPNDTTRFDGYTLEVPTIEVAGVGEVQAQFQLVDPNELVFQLTQAVITGGIPGPPPISGIQLFDCASFTPPVVGGVAAGISTYSTTSGILDVPSADLNGEQIAIRLEYIEGTNPWLFETLALDTVQAGPSESTASSLDGSLVTEPARDFISLCHGWVLIGDFIRNRVVERNIISGETGATYNMNTRPDQFTLDVANNAVYMTVHPETERLYRLDLVSGVITHYDIEQTLLGTMGLNYTYRWALRDIALGENGNLFAIMFDGEGFDPENGAPFSDTGLWLGLFDGNGNFLTDSLPLEEPIRVEYEPVLDHLFLTTQSNLATFNFDPATNTLSFVVGTDIQVGSNCTDFDVSPDGNRLAYTCPTGNRGDEDDFSIVDMDPENYYNSDGEWFLTQAPVSATFNADGTLLIATDNERLYFFDAARHLILEDFELGLLEGETIKKIRISRDGNLLYVFLNNEIHEENSKFYYMNMPNITAGP